MKDTDQLPAEPKALANELSEKGYSIQLVDGEPRLISTWKHSFSHFTRQRLAAGLTMDDVRELVAAGLPRPPEMRDLWFVLEHSIDSPTPRPASASGS